MKIYTKTGDKGETALATGARIAKDHVQLEAIGTADELNSQLGLLRALTDSHAMLHQLQHLLFNLGANLAGNQQYPFSHQHTQALEQEIDRLTALLPPLTQFILPAGSKASAQAQVCRAIARRLERRVVALHQQQPLPEEILQWTNRLSDYLFTLARALNTEPEAPWQPEPEKTP